MTTACYARHMRAAFTAGFLAVLLLAGCNGGGTTIGQSDASTSSSAESSVSSAAFSDASSASPPSASSADSLPTRRLLTKELHDSLQNQLLETTCDISIIGNDFYFDDPTETVTYQNGALGFSASIPYNPHWGTERFSVTPFDEEAYGDSKWLAFGPVGVGEGCGFSRMWTISIGKRETPEQIIAEQVKSLHEQYLDNPIPESAMPKKEQAGANTVVVMNPNGFCDSPTVVVIGPDAVYAIAMTCNEASEKHFATLKAIAASMEFIAQ